MFAFIAHLVRSVARSGRLWRLAFGFLAGLAAAELGTATWLVFFRPPVSPDTQRSPMDAGHWISSQLSESSASAVLAVHDQTGGWNQPVPLGILLRGGSGQERVILEPIPEGFDVSLGTRLAANRWSIGAAELDEAFVAAPIDFMGSIEVTAKLYSGASELLETATIRFAWKSGRPLSQRGSAMPLTTLLVNSERLLELGVPSLQPAFRCPAAGANANPYELSFDAAFPFTRAVAFCRAAIGQPDSIGNEEAGFADWRRSGTANFSPPAACHERPFSPILTIGACP